MKKRARREDQRRPESGLPEPGEPDRAPVMADQAPEAAEAADRALEPEATSDSLPGSPGQGAGVVLVEPAEQALVRLEREAEEWKDRALRAAADLDNYRKRALRERDEMYGRGKVDVLAGVVEVIDDLARVAHLDPEQTTSQALHEGMLQIERKFLKVLEGLGVERIDPIGERFDPNAHEAVLTLPADSPDADHTVGTVLQHGYRFRGMLLRPARVGVRTWSPPEGQVNGGEGAS